MDVGSTAMTIGQTTPVGSAPSTPTDHQRHLLAQAARARVFIRLHEREEVLPAYHHLQQDTTNQKVTLQLPLAPIELPAASAPGQGRSSPDHSPCSFASSKRLTIRVDGLSLPAPPTGVILKQLQERVAHVRRGSASSNTSSVVGHTLAPPSPPVHHLLSSSSKKASGHFDHLPSVLVTVVCHFLDTADLRYFIATNRHARDTGLLPHSWKFIPRSPSERVYRSAIQPFVAGLVEKSASAAVLSCGSSDVHVRRAGEFFHHPQFEFDSQAAAGAPSPSAPGPEEGASLVLRAAEDIFRMVHQRQVAEAAAAEEADETDDMDASVGVSRTETVVRMSFLCVRQERLEDLLDDWRDRASLVIQENADGLYIPNMTAPRLVESVGDVERLLAHAVQGARGWEQARNFTLSTASKITSFHIAQRRRWRRGGGGRDYDETIHQSSLHLVDARAGFRLHDDAHMFFASSPSAAAAAVAHQHIRTIPIDLHNVVTAQSSASWKFVPWRDGKFTRLLQKYIGECARVALLVNIAPLESSPQTIVELMQFAARFRQMKPKDQHQQPLLAWMLPPPKEDEWRRARATANERQ